MRILATPAGVVLARYLAALVLVRLALAWPVLTAIYLAFDLGDQGRRLASEVGWPAVLRAALLHLPHIAVQLLPAALLLAIVLALGTLRRRHELLSLYAAGASPLRLGLPLLGIGLGCAALAYLVLEFAVPPAERRADAHYAGRRASALLGAHPSSTWTRSGSWLVQLTRRANDLHLLALERDPRGAIGRRLEGRVSPSDPTRVLEARELRPSPSGGWTVAHARERRWPLLAELGPLVVAAPPRPEALTSRELAQLIARARAADRPSAALAVLLHTRVSFPLFALVAALLGWSFGLGGAARPLLRDLTLAVGFIVGLWLLLATGWLLARAGTIPPPLGAWLPVGLALSGAILVLRRRWPRLTAS